MNYICLTIIIGNILKMSQELRSFIRQIYNKGHIDRQLLFCYPCIWKKPDLGGVADLSLNDNTVTDSSVTFSNLINFLVPQVYHE